MIKVWAKNNRDFQLDSYTGDILQVAYRRSDMVEAAGREGVVIAAAEESKSASYDGDVREKIDTPTPNGVAYAYIEAKLCKSDHLGS